jgi:hypothetical protein
MTMRRRMAAVVLAVLAGQAGQAGQDPVTPVPLVFVPPVIVPPVALPGAPEASGAVSGAAPEAASGAAAGAAGAAAAAPEADAVTAGVATRITQVTELCRDLPDRAYTIDCVAAGLAEIAAALPDTGDRAAARAALSDAAANLRDLAQANRSRSQPRVTVRRGNVASPRPLVAVVPSAETAAAAAAIVAQAQTALLRSAPDSAADGYARISAALDTTRILLRSG